MSDGGESELVEHLRRTLPAPGRIVVDARDLDLRHADVERRSLLHQALAERWQDVGDVVEEHRVRADDQHSGARQATTMFEEQVRGAV